MREQMEKLQQQEQQRLQLQQHIEQQKRLAQMEVGVGGQPPPGNAVKLVLTFSMFAYLSDH